MEDKTMTEKETMTNAKTEEKKINDTAEKQDNAKTKETKKKKKRTVSKTKKLEARIEELEHELEASKDKYLRLQAEFDNYRRRTLQEKADLIKNAGESTLLEILPILDDFERAITANKDSDDLEAIKDGIKLIYNKLKTKLENQGIKEIDALHQDFNTDLHEAITKIPAPEETLKGKIVDVIEKGYYLNDKVLRFSKVVIGE
jgi:molecular chaperone GrpE